MARPGSAWRPSTPIRTFCDAIRVQNFRADRPPRRGRHVPRLQLQDEIDSMQLTPASSAIVPISSPGGYCSEARGMYGMLRNLPCRTVALYIEGDARQCAVVCRDGLRNGSGDGSGRADRSAVPWACTQGVQPRLTASRPPRYRGCHDGRRLCAVRRGRLPKQSRLG